MSVRVPDERLDAVKSKIHEMIGCHEGISGETQRLCVESREDLAALVADLRDARADNQRLRGAPRRAPAVILDYRAELERRVRAHMDEADASDDEGAHVGFARHHRALAAGLNEAVQALDGALAEEPVPDLDAIRAREPGEALTAAVDAAEAVYGYTPGIGRAREELKALTEAVERAFHLAIPYVVDAADRGDAEAEGDLQRLRAAFDPLLGIA